MSLLCLSCRPGEPGYGQFLKLGRRRTGVRVLLNGVEMSKVIAVDEMRRTLKRYVTDERGRYVLNAARTEILTETIYGDVVILLPEGA